MPHLFDPRPPFTIDPTAPFAGPSATPAKAGADDKKLVEEAADLLEKMLHLEPDKRLQVG
jgi:hypothetical protein